MLFTLKSSLSMVSYSAAIAFSEMWKKIWRKEKRAAEAESSAVAVGAQWVAAESSAASAGWSAVAEAQWVAAESSAATARAQWAAEKSSVAAGWSAAEYKSGSFEKSERERERGILTRIRSVNFELDTRSTPRCPIGHLGWRREGGGGGVCPHPSPQAKVPDWVLGMGKGGGRGRGLPHPSPQAKVLNC